MVDSDAFVFVAESVKDPDAILIAAVPPLDGEAVNVAVYVVPEPEIADRVPRVTEMSSRVKVDVVSLAVNVIVDVPPDEIEPGLALTVIVGAAVSNSIVKMSDAELLFPAESVNLFAVTEMEPVPD